MTDINFRPEVPEALDDAPDAKSDESLIDKLFTFGGGRSKPTARWLVALRESGTHEDRAWLMYKLIDATVPEGLNFQDDRAYRFNIDPRQLVKSTLDDVDGDVTINGIEFPAEEVKALKETTASISTGVSSRLVQDLKATYRQEPGENTDDYEKRLAVRADKLAESYLVQDDLLMPPTLTPDDLDVDEEGNVIAAGDAPDFVQDNEFTFSDITAGGGAVTVQNFMSAEQRQRLITSFTDPVDAF